MDILNFQLSEKQQVVTKNLLSMNDEQVISLIQEFRVSGELFIVEPLIEMLYSNRGQALKNSILEFIRDIKNQVAVIIITKSIQKHITDKYTTGLVSACWQSSLDFSDELPVFFDILCEGDYQTAFEAFTVIENSIGNVSQENISLYMASIESKLKITPTEKQTLLSEMMAMLENFKRNGLG